MTKSLAFVRLLVVYYILFATAVRAKQLYVAHLQVKGELNPKIDFSSFEHLGIVEQLYEVFLSC